MAFFLVVAGLVSSGAVVAAMKSKMASKGKREQVQSLRLK
jgi:hypothetical protein